MSTVPQAGRGRARRQQGWFLLRPPSQACSGHLPVPSHCVSSHRDTGQAGSEPTLTPHFHLVISAKTPSPQLVTFGGTQFSLYHAPRLVLRQPSLSVSPGGLAPAHASHPRPGASGAAISAPGSISRPLWKCVTCSVHPRQPESPATPVSRLPCTQRPEATAEQPGPSGPRKGPSARTGWTRGRVALGPWKGHK